MHKVKCNWHRLGFELKLPILLPMKKIYTKRSPTCDMVILIWYGCSVIRRIYRVIIRNFEYCWYTPYFGTCVHIDLYMWSFTVSKVKLATLAERDPKVPFLIATTLKCRGGHYSIPWIPPLYPWSLLLMLSVKQGSIKYHFFFWVFGMIQPGIEPRSPRPLVSTLLIRPMARLSSFIICMS